MKTSFIKLLCAIMFASPIGFTNSLRADDLPLPSEPPTDDGWQYLLPALPEEGPPEPQPSYEEILEDLFEEAYPEYDPTSVVELWEDLLQEDEDTAQFMFDLIMGESAVPDPEPPAPPADNVPPGAVET